MKTVRTVADLRAALEPHRRAPRTIGLVPTMGALHEGHMSLVRHARAQTDVLVVSLFVNPAQFNERSDLESYPRCEQRDAELLAAAGADLLFAPPIQEVYPAGFATAVEVLGLTERLEGATRGSEHFRGVATVVTKLLCMVAPHVAYFGQKDAQQVVVIRRLVEDLNLPLRVETLATVREPDGLAMSSRNVLLSAAERRRALAIPAALHAAHERAVAGERSAAALVDAARAQMRLSGIEPEYVELVDPASFEPLDLLGARGLLVIAARIGGVRLIDNVVLEPSFASSSHQPLPGRAIA
jgi:pantoate--beta-alanine ligase